MTALSRDAGLEAVRNLKSEVRRKVAALGEPRVSAAFHLFIAEVEGRRGDLDASLNHTVVAQSILSRNPNLWLEGVASIQQCCIGFMTSDFDAALAAAREALRLSERSGHFRTKVAALADMGALHLGRGEFEAAWISLSNALAISIPGGESHFALLETCADLKLAQRDWTACEELLDRMKSAVSGLSLSHPDWHERWCVLTRLRMLQQQGRRAETVALARDGAALAAAHGDEPMLRQFRLLQAAGHIARDEFPAATRLMTSVVNAARGPDLAVLAEVARLQGLAAARDGCLASASRHFERSLIVLGGLGNTRARIDAVDDYAATLWDYSHPETDDPELTEPGAEEEAERPTKISHRLDTCSPIVEFSDDDPTLAIQESVRLLDLATHPEIFGEELLRLLYRTESLRYGALYSARLGKKAERMIWCGEPIEVDGAPSDLPIRIVLRDDPAREMFLELWPNPSLSSWMACLDAARMGRAAVQPAGMTIDEDAASAWVEDRSGDTELGVFGSPTTIELLGNARRIGPTSLNVLITGESGTGKEVLARVIHKASRRAGAAFVPFNCTSMPRDMVESQLFGYRRGAFTGAGEAFPGVIRGASGGTLFLDEIGDFALELQPKLLRFLDSGEIHPLGEAAPVKVDVRVIAATNADLDKLVLDGRFREDLYYRLNVVRFRIPPLRDRREEIPLFVTRFLHEFTEENEKPGLKVADETLEYLLLYRWPGNVRQLAHEIRRCVALAEPGTTLTPEHLSPEIVASRRTVASTPGVESFPRVLVPLDQPLAAGVEALERAMLTHALAAGAENFESAARKLGLSRKGLYLKRQRLGI